MSGGAIVVLCLICGCIGAIMNSNDKRKEKKEERNRLDEERQEIEDQRRYEKELRDEETEREIKIQTAKAVALKKLEQQEDNKLKGLEKQKKIELKNNEGSIEYAYNLLSKNEDSSNKKAIKTLKKLAKAGDKRAQQKLGDIYSIGEIVPADYKEAEKWEKYE